MNNTQVEGREGGGGDEMETGGRQAELERKGETEWDVVLSVLITND